MSDYQILLSNLMALLFGVIGVWILAAAIERLVDRFFGE